MTSEHLRSRGKPYRTLDVYRKLCWYDGGVATRPGAWQRALEECVTISCVIRGNGRVSLSSRLLHKMLIGKRPEKTFPKHEITTPC